MYKSTTHHAHRHHGRSRADKRAMQIPLAIILSIHNNIVKRMKSQGFFSIFMLIALIFNMIIVQLAHIIFSIFCGSTLLLFCVHTSLSVFLIFFATFRPKFSYFPAIFPQKIKKKSALLPTLIIVFNNFCFLLFLLHKIFFFCSEYFCFSTKIFNIFVHFYPQLSRDFPTKFSSFSKLFYIPLVGLPYTLLSYNIYRFSFIAHHIGTVHIN